MKIKYIFTTIILLLMCSLTYAQKPAKVYEQVDVMPEYINGENNLMPFLLQNIQYPEAAKKDNIQGKVFVKFIVDESGNVVEPRVEKGIGNGCDEEAIRVTKLLKFKPGKENNKPVAVKMVLPYVFKLDGNDKPKDKPILK